ncbi:MAG: succinylglutamate desuccinylase/aspartoacylase family protein [Bacteroidales bacterium]|nr:succinylglutamate desuccinylase/aspartoacylase family protein [Bacteroidales bacterium]
MKKEILFQMKSTYRDDFKIEGYRFGSGEETVCIVGPMRGDEVQQQYICSQIVHELQQAESEGLLQPDRSILVIPSCNPFSMNVSRRFWAMDGTDINRMFPGYDQGETTQRIAAAIFKRIENFKYGVQLASFYVPGEFVPHVRMLRTGYEDVESARLFGMPYVTVRKPLPFDTALLNYNWQIWNTSAFSLYAGRTDCIDQEDSRQAVDAMMRFLVNVGAIEHTHAKPGYLSDFVNEDDLTTLSAHHAGIYVRRHKAGDSIKAGEVLACIMHPYDGRVLEEVRSPYDGTIFFSHHRPLVLQNALLYRIIPT